MVRSVTVKENHVDPIESVGETPSLRVRVPDLEQQVKTLTDKLANIDNSWNQRTAEMQQKVAASDSVISELQKRMNR